MLRHLITWLRNRRTARAGCVTPAVARAHVAAVPVPEAATATANNPHGASAAEGSELRRVLTVNGTPLPEATSRTVGIIAPDGRIAELEQTAVLQLGDGTFVDRLDDRVGQCSLCLTEAAQVVAQSSIPSTEPSAPPTDLLLRSLCRRDALRSSSVSGIALCPRHRCTIDSPEGPLIVSTNERTEIERAERRKRIRRQLLSLFVESTP